MSKMSKASVQTLVNQLTQAAQAYYETDTPLMSDSAYDALVEQLTELDPTNHFLTQIGSSPCTNAVPLPVSMPSLDKRKPDTLKSNDLSKGPYILSDKLDGISALWCCEYTGTQRLYLRGDGIQGMDASHCCKGIQGLKPCNGIVRGELIVPKGSIAGTLARNWVNGLLHQTTPSKEDLSKVRFVAYQVCKPASLTRSQQITWLQNNGFEVAWFRIEAKPTTEGLSALFKERRVESAYECDGIVVGQDSIPIQTASNPKDAFAFKMPLDDQKAQTIVKDVLWASSKTGKWIPRIQFEPVKIGTASIEYCTGFHAQHIFTHTIGPGARIIVRRSGDVIPTLEACLTPSPGGWKQPPNGCWTWDANHIHALDTSTVVSVDKQALELTHELVSLGVEGINKTSAKKLVEGGSKTLHSVVQTSLERLQTLLGPGNGAKLHTALPLCLAKATQHQWIQAYLGWPKGFGATRIAAVLTLEPTVAKWSTLGLPPKGISADSFAEILQAVPGYLKWRATFSLPGSVELPVVKKAVVPIKGHYVLSGFRDADLQANLEAAGWIQQDRITKATTLLLVPTTEQTSTKVQAARASGIRILPRDQVDTLFQTTL